MTETTDTAGALPREARKWAMICHLSALVGLMGNGVGFLLAPLIIWLIKKEDHPFIDEQGKEAVNFQITMFIALLLGALLTLVVVGIVLLIAAAILMTVLPIVAGVKANKGEAYQYPLTIRFIK
jgi:uncharacterized Tic20 family protein